MEHRIACSCLLLAATTPAFASGPGMQQAFARDMLACGETVAALRLQSSGHADPDLTAVARTYYDAAEHAAGDAYLVEAAPAARERGLDDARTIIAGAGGRMELDAAAREFATRCNANRDAYWRAVGR